MYHPADVTLVGQHVLQKSADKAEGVLAIVQTVLVGHGYEAEEFAHGLRVVVGREGGRHLYHKLVLLYAYHGSVLLLFVEVKYELPAQGLHVGLAVTLGTAYALLAVVQGTVHQHAAYAVTHRPAGCHVMDMLAGDV